MSFDDERVRFYFRHREQIEQWAALRSEAAAAVDEWMTQLGPDIEELARSLGPDVQFRGLTDTEQAYPSYRLTRAAWGFGNVNDPPACVSLEWLRGRTTMRGGSTPYVGLRAPKVNPVGASLRTSEPVRQSRLVRKDLTSQWWVAYAYVAPPGDFPVNADGYRDALLDGLRAVWQAFAPHVEAAIRA
jgi:hypothetical protein